MLAEDQNEKLKKENEGQGFFDVIGEMANRGTWNPAVAMSGRSNEIAKIVAGEARIAELDAAEKAIREVNHPEMVTPQERAARSFSETNTTTTNKAEVVIRDETGKASFSKEPVPGSGISLVPSGAF